MLPTPKKNSDLSRHRILIDVDDSIVFRLFVFANLTSRPFQAFARRYRLTLAEWRVMVTLAAHPRISGAGVVARTGLEKMTVSRSIRSLEIAGRVRRTIGTVGRRHWAHELTDEGWLVYDAIAPASHSRAEEVVSSLSSNERLLFKRVIEKLIDRLQ